MGLFESGLVWPQLSIFGFHIAWFSLICFSSSQQLVIKGFLPGWQVLPREIPMNTK